MKILAYKGRKHKEHNSENLFRKVTCTKLVVLFSLSDISIQGSAVFFYMKCQIYNFTSSK